MTPANVTPETLAKYRLFAGLSSDILAKIASITSVQSFDRDEEIFATGDTAHAMFIVVEGRINVLIDAGAAGTITVSTIGEGESLGWSGVIQPHYFSATARAVDAGTALVVNAPALRRLMAENCEVGSAMLTRAAQMLAIRLRDTRYQLIGMIHH